MAKFLYEHTLGVHIEGIPSDEDGNKTGGAIFYYGTDPLEWGYSSSYGYEPLLFEVVGSIDGRIDPYLGKFDLSASGIVLLATESLCQRLFIHAPLPRWKVGSFASFGGSGVITIETLFPPEVGSHIYIQDETLHVNHVADIGGGEYNVDVTRGIGGSEARSFISGTNIYASPPYHAKRIITLYLYEPGGEDPIPLWQGLLEEIQTDSQQTVLEVTAYELLSTLVSAKGNENPNRFQWDLRSTGTNIEGFISDDNLPSVEWASRTANIHTARVDEAIVRFSLEGTTGIRLAGPTQLGTTAPEEGRFSTEAVEVLMLDRDGRLSSGPTSVAHNPFNGLTGDLHPAAVALAFLLSTGEGYNDPPTGTYDILGRHFGLGIPNRLIEWESWESIILEGREAHIDQLLLEGSIDFQDLILQKLLLPAGLFPVINNRGRLALRRLSTFSVDDIEDILDNCSWSVLIPERIDLDRNLSKNHHGITGSFGGIAGIEPDKITTRVVRGNRSDANLSSGGYEYDFSLYYRESSDERSLWLQDQAEIRRDHAPTLHCSVPLDHLLEGRAGMEGGSVPSLGSWMLIEGGPETGIIGPNGTRVQIADSLVLFIGLLVGRTLNLANRVVECDILLTNWMSGDLPPRMLAPSGRVTSYSHFTPSITLADELRSRLDTTGFQEGDSIALYHEDGRRWWGSGSGSMEILSINEASRTLTLNTSVDITVSDEISRGLYVRLESRESYFPPSWSGTDYFGEGFRRFAHISKPSTPEVEQDIYS